MQVSFNPIISDPRRNQPSHKAVIPKYVELAKKDIQKYGKMDSVILIKILEYIILFKKISIQDGIDTFEAIKKITPNALNVIEDYLDSLKD